MTMDSFRPSMLRVTISAAGLGGGAPADGFIDPISIYKYRQLQTSTGTVGSPTVTNGETIIINGTTVTFATGGLNLAGIIASINDLTDVHHVIASNSAGNLQLTNEATYETFGLTVMGTPAVLAEIGFVAPVNVFVFAQVDTLAHSLAKVRANERWNLLTKLLGTEVSPLHIGGVELVGATINAAASEISFTVTYHDFNAIFTYDESNNNVLIKGSAAVKRNVARALIATRNIVIPVFDPTHVTIGTGYFEKGELATSVVVAAIAPNLATAEANITVEIIALTR